MTQFEYDTIGLIVFIFLALISFLIKEGAERAFDKLDKSPTNPLSKLYHIMSFFVRASLFLALMLATKDMELSTRFKLWGLFVFVAWPLYNVVINLFRGDKFYYVGKGGIDGLIRKLLSFINFDR